MDPEIHFLVVSAILWYILHFIFSYIQSLVAIKIVMVQRALSKT